MTTYYIVNFGSSLGVAHDFVNVIADLGYRPAGAGGRVRIDEATVAGLRQLAPGTDGAIRDEQWTALDGGDEGSMPHVRMGGYAYPVWPESAGPEIETRRAAAAQPGT